MERIEKFHKNHEIGFSNQIIKFREILENGTVIDIGSNIGLITLAICKNIKYKSIHLFEPCEEYLNYSKELLSNYDNLNFYNFGLSNVSEEKTLYMSKSDNIGWNTFLDKDPLQADTFTQRMEHRVCKLRKLDDFSFEQVNFIKIDVEGYEAFVIEGGFETIKKFKPHIYVEVGWGTSHPNWDYNYEVYKKLFDIGYKEVEFDNSTKDILFEPI